MKKSLAVAKFLEVVTKEVTARKILAVDQDIHNVGYFDNRLLQ